MLVFAAVHPLVTGLSDLVRAAAARDWKIRQRHRLVVPVVVLAMVFVIIPGIDRRRGH